MSTGHTQSMSIGCAGKTNQPKEEVLHSHLIGEMSEMLHEESTSHRFIMPISVLKALSTSVMKYLNFV